MRVGVAQRLGDTEVDEQRMAVGDHDVVGLDVAVHDALPMRMREAVDHVAQEAHGVGRRERAVARDQAAKRIALHVRHHVVEQAVGLARVEQREDVRRLELGGDVDLAQEARAAERLRELGAEDLDGDDAVVAQVACEVHGGHAAVAELAFDRVALAEGVDQSVMGLAHGETVSVRDLLYAQRAPSGAVTQTSGPPRNPSIVPPIAAGMVPFAPLAALNFTTP